MHLDPILTASPVTGAIRPVTGDLLANAYLAPTEPVDVAAALAKRPAPWSESLAVAPEATAAVVEAGLIAVARASPRLHPADIDPTVLPSGRARAHLDALLDLWHDLGAPPGELGIWARVLCSAGEDALEPLPPLDPRPCVFSDNAERALHAVLLEDHGAADPAALADWQARQAPRDATAPGAAGHLQAVLGRSSEATAPDATVAAFGLRDPREEAMFAAARAQALLDAGTVAAPSEIGVLAPGDAAYAAAIQEAFDRVGLPLSGGHAEPAARDSAGELLSLVLVALERPAPRTALASLCLSPLAPWPRDTGRRMAREVMDRGWSPIAADLDGPGRDLFDALRPAQTPEQLFGRLHAVAKAVPEAKLHPRIAALRAAAEALDWPALHAAAAPRIVPATGHDRFVEGVTLLAEAALPWRPVRHLIVTGLMGRRYPHPPGNDPFFTEGEIAAINAATPLELPGRRQRLARGLALFRRQLCAATEGLTLLAPACDLKGDALPASTGLALIAHALGTAPDKLMREIRAEPPEAWPVAAHRPAPVPRGGAPALPADGLVHLGTDLLRRREAPEGGSARQSPSRLETLLVSPLAWLLDELDAGDRTWAPESLDVMTLGSILHRVMELVFPAGTRDPQADTVRAAVPAALEAAIDRYARWLAVPAWETERASLLREAQDVCAAWAAFLRETGAEVLHNETWLSGYHGGLLLHGKADCFLRLPDGRILLVDHKRSRAGGRRDRMSKGWDLQVALYAAMLERSDETTALTDLVEDGAQVVTAYHTMLDATVLSDAGGTGLPGLEPAQGDVSEHAMAELADRVAEVGAGTIRLNRAGDAEWLKKEAGITAYALEGNAFVAAFTLPEEDPE
jgi:hypothetical protein